MVAAVILAAGRSTRMGRSKPLLPHGTAIGLTFVSHLIAAAGTAGLTRIIVVGRPGDDPVRAEVTGAGAVFAENPAADEGQLSSLQAGLRALQGEPGVDAIMVMPVDVPLITPGVLTRLLEAAAASTAVILRATCAGRHGHPVIFKRSVFDELHAADPAVGAKAVVRADPRRVEDVDVQEPGVALDVDTPADYLRAFGRQL